MKPVNFPEQNIVFAEDQKEYQPLPACKTIEGIVVSCWEPTEEEILKLIETRKIYISQMTFNQPLQPLFACVFREDIFTK